MSTATANPSPVDAPPGALTLGLRRVRIELKQFFRDRNSALWNFAFPVILLVIFGSVFGGQSIAPSITFARYFVAGMIAARIFDTSEVSTHENVKP